MLGFSDLLVPVLWGTSLVLITISVHLFSKYISCNNPFHLCFTMSIYSVSTGHLLWVLWHSSNGKEEIVEKLVPRTTLGQFLCFLIKRFATAGSNCGISRTVNPAISSYQFNNDFKEINIFNYIFFYNKPLKQPPNTLNLPSEPSGSNNSSARADLQQADSSSCRFWLNFPWAALSETHMTGFCSPQKINWKISAEQTSRAQPCF